METLKVCIVGLGGIFNCAHVYGWNAAKGIDVVGVCDINPDKFENAKKLNYSGYRTYTDYKEMIDKEKPDIVDICTPNYLHADIAIYALDHGANAFSEKPDTISVDRAIAMKKAQERSGKVLMVMRNNRWRGTSIDLKKRIESGEFGDIYAGRCGWVRTRGIPGKGGWFTTKAQSGGGPLIDLGVHMIDLAIYLMGNPKPISVSGSTFTKFANNNDKGTSVHSNFGEAKADGIFDVEDLAMGFIKFDNGACLQIEFSWASNVVKEGMFVELRGDKKGCTWTGRHYDVYDGVTKPSFIAKCKETIRQTALGDDGHRQNILHFVDVVKNGTKPNFVIDQGINMVKILTGIYKSAETGKEVLLDD